MFSWSIRIKTRFYKYADVIQTLRTGKIKLFIFCAIYGSASIILLHVPVYMQMPRE